jgi:hypothetical protein
MVPWFKQTYPVLSFALQLDSVLAQVAITALKFLWKDMAFNWPSALSSPFLLQPFSWAPQNGRIL